MDLKEAKEPMSQAGEDKSTQQNSSWNASAGRPTFWQSHNWPFVMIVLLTVISALAFTPRFAAYLIEGHWGQSATKAFEFAPDALNTHALLGMALIPLFLMQPALGLISMRQTPPPWSLHVHRWHGRILVGSTVILSLLGFYITFTFAANSDSITSVIFMFLVASFVIIFFGQAVWEARRKRVDRHLDAIVFAMIFVTVPATGRLIEAVMRGFGIENTRSREPVPLGFGYHVELVDFTILLVSSVPIVVWAIYAMPRRMIVKHKAKLWIASLFLGLPFVAVTAQTVLR